MLKKNSKMDKKGILAAVGVSAVMAATVCTAGIRPAYAEDVPAVEATTPVPTGETAPEPAPMPEGQPMPSGEAEPQPETPGDAAKPVDPNIEQMLENVKHLAHTALEKAADKAKDEIKALNIAPQAEEKALKDLNAATAHAYKQVKDARDSKAVDQAEASGIASIGQVVNNAKPAPEGADPENPPTPLVPEQSQPKPQANPAQDGKTTTPAGDKTAQAGASQQTKSEDTKTTDKKMTKGTDKAKTPTTADGSMIGAAAVISAIGSAMAVLGIKSKENN